MMANKAVPFRMADLKRAVAGASAGGMQIGRAEIEPSGKIILVAKTEVEASVDTDLDKWLKNRAG